MNTRLHELAVRDALGKMLPPPTDQEWDWLRGQGWVVQAIEEVRPVSDLSEVLKESREVFGGPGAKAVASTPPYRAGHENLAREEAIRALLADQASEEPEVLRFRSEVLEGKLLSEDGVKEWIEGRACGDGPATLLCDAFQEKSGPLWNWGAAPRFDLVWNRSPHEPDPQATPVSRGGVLDRLNQLSHTLSLRYGWPEAEATNFVLTDTAPPYRVMGAEYRPNEEAPVASRIVMTIDPVSTPRTVAAVYADFRRAQLGARPYRALKEKHARLAQFSASRPKQEGWTDRMAAWNEARPQWRYQWAARFKRDTLVARQRLLRMGKREVGGNNG